MFNFSDAAEVAPLTLGSLVEGETFHFKDDDMPMIKTDESDDGFIMIVSLSSGVLFRECSDRLVRIVTLNVASTST